MMKNFITVTSINAKGESQNEITININSIANFKTSSKNFTDKKQRTVLVYKNEGLINSSIYTQETAQEIKNLINKAT